MKEYVVRSNYDFLMNIAGQEYILDKFHSYTLKVENNEENSILKFYPLFGNPKSLPFCTRLNNLTENITSRSINGLNILEVFPYKILTCDEIYMQQVFNYNNETIIVNTAQNKLLVFCNDCRIMLDCTNAEDFKFNIENNKLIGISKTNVLVVDLDTKKYCYENFEKLNKHNNSFELLQNLKDFSGHLCVKSVSLENKNFSTKTELYYKNNCPNIATNPNIIPMVVLDLVKLGDLDLAKSYISNTIPLSVHQLKDFFGEYDCYEILNGEYYLIKNNRAYKKLKFIINNKTIIDIEDENLF